MGSGVHGSVRGLCFTRHRLSIIRHLHKLGLHNSGLCDFCEEPETVKHYLLDCLKYQQYQENLIDFAVKNNIKLTIESILKNRDMFPLIYDYVLKTKKEI